MFEARRHRAPTRRMLRRLGFAIYPLARATLLLVGWHLGMFLSTDAAAADSARAERLHVSGPAVKHSVLSSIGAKSPDPVVGAPSPCRLVSGKFAIILQFLLVIMCLVALFFKWAREIRAGEKSEKQETDNECQARSFTEWLMDISKQAISAAVIHVANIVMALALAHIKISNNPHVHPDQCAWYLINYIIDVFVGLTLVWGLLKVSCFAFAAVTLRDSAHSALAGLFCFVSAFSGDSYQFFSLVVFSRLQRLSINFQFTESIARHFDYPMISETGYYGPPGSPDFGIFFVQLSVFIAITLLSKGIITLVLVPLARPLGQFGLILAHPLRNYPEIELLVVMVIIPAILNIASFWIVDSIIQRRDSKANFSSHKDDGRGEYIVVEEDPGMGGSPGISNAYRTDPWADNLSVDSADLFYDNQITRNASARDRNPKTSIIDTCLGGEYRYGDVDESAALIGADDSFLESGDFTSICDDHEGSINVAEL